MKCQDWIYIKIIEFISSLQICIANQYVSNHPSQRTEQPRVQTNGYQRILVHLKNVQIPAIVCQFSSQQPKCYAKNRYVRWKFISLEFFTLRFFCFLSKIYWPSILVHFDWKTSLISAIIRMTHTKKVQRQRTDVMCQQLKRISKKTQCTKHLFYVLKLPQIRIYCHSRKRSKWLRVTIVMSNVRGQE